MKTIKQTTLSFKQRLYKIFKTALFFFNLALVGLTLIFLIFNLAFSRGILWINLALLGLAILYALFLVLTFFFSKSKLLNTIGAKTYKYLRWAFNGVSLGVQIYALFTSAVDPTFWSIALVVLLTISFLGQIVLEILIYVLMHQIKKYKQYKAAAKTKKNQDKQIEASKPLGQVEEDETVEPIEADELSY